MTHEPQQPEPSANGSADTEPTPDATRTGLLVILGALAVGGIGYFIGLDDGKTPGRAAPNAEPSGQAIDGQIPPAPRYLELSTINLGPNASFASDLRRLVEPEPDLFAPVARTTEQTEWTRTARADRRAYDGAPPVVPHPIQQRSAAACIACHGEGKTIGDRVAPRMSHGLLVNCTQCHAESSSPLPSGSSVDPIAATSFHGLASPGQGTRAWEGAPPTIPHHTFMRESCAACHGPRGAHGIRTTHPWRTSCTQCHAPDASLDQRPSLARPTLPSIDAGKESSP